MKKLLLSAALLSSAFLTYAQLGANGFQDDFSSTDEYDGVHWWGEADLDGDANPNFQATYERGTDGVTYTVTQGQGEFTPFGVGFGENNGSPVTIDFTGDFSYELIVENPGDSAIRVRIAPQDTAGNLIDTDANWDNGDIEGNAWKYTIDIALQPGESDTLKMGSQNSSNEPEGILSGTFAGGFFADYSVNPGPTRNTDANPAAISAILVTVTNNNSTGAPLWQQLALDQQLVKIKFLRVGEAPEAVGLNELKENVLSIYPNPASDLVQFGQELFNVQMTNAQGQQVMSLESASSVDVSSLEKGLYMISSDRGSTQVIVE